MRTPEPANANPNNPNMLPPRSNMLIKKIFAWGSGVAFALSKLVARCAELASVGINAPSAIPTKLHITGRRVDFSGDGGGVE
jgi:hypothetical protein